MTQKDSAEVRLILAEEMYVQNFIILQKKNRFLNQWESMGFPKLTWFY